MTTGETGPQTAIEHLQRSAIEMIAAARAALDTLDAVVAEPPRPGDIFGRVGPLADAFWDWVASATGSAPATHQGSAEGPAPEQPDGRPGTGRGRTPVEHIPVR